MVFCISVQRAFVCGWCYCQLLLLQTMVQSYIYAYIYIWLIQSFDAAELPSHPIPPPPPIGLKAAGFSFWYIGDGDSSPKMYVVHRDEAYMRSSLCTDDPNTHGGQFDCFRVMLNRAESLLLLPSTGSAYGFAQHTHIQINSLYNLRCDVRR